MGVWGKMFGGVAGFAVGGPFGALMGAALGHAADRGSLLDAPAGGWNDHWHARGRPDPNGAAFMAAAKVSSFMGKNDQLYAIGLVALCAKVAKIDGPVNRREIDAFKQCFRFPPDNAREVGLLFDRARDRTDDFEMYGRELGRAFANDRAPLEDLLVALFTIARADVRPVARSTRAKWTSSNAPIVRSACRPAHGTAPRRAAHDRTRTKTTPIWNSASRATAPTRKSASAGARSCASITPTFWAARTWTQRIWQRHRIAPPGSTRPGTASSATDVFKEHQAACRALSMLS